MSDAAVFIEMYLKVDEYSTVRQRYMASLIYERLPGEQGFTG